MTLFLFFLHIDCCTNLLLHSPAFYRLRKLYLPSLHMHNCLPLGYVNMLSGNQLKLTSRLTYGGQHTLIGKLMNQGICFYRLSIEGVVYPLCGFAQLFWINCHVKQKSIKFPTCSGIVFCWLTLSCQNIQKTENSPKSHIFMFFRLLSLKLVQYHVPNGVVALTKWVILQKVSIFMSHTWFDWELIKLNFFFFNNVLECILL